MEKIFREIKKRIDFRKSKNLSFPPHIHDDIELVFVKKGRTTAYCDGKKYTLKENSFFLVFPNQVHHYSECVDGEYVVIIIKPSKLFSYKVFLKTACLLLRYGALKRAKTITRCCCWILQQMNFSETDIVWL